MIGKGAGLACGALGGRGHWVPPGYHLTFSEEFDGALSVAANTSAKWQSQFPWGGRTPGSDELVYYSDPSVNGVNPFSVHDSVLDIIAANAGANPADGRPYTSGMLTTYPSFNQLYGYFEMRAKLPQGRSFWPAFWMATQDQSWPPEIDIMECFGGDNGNFEGGSNQVHCGVWEQVVDGAHGGGGWFTVNGNIFTDFHVYSALWEPTKISFYFDGVKISERASDITKPMYLIVNLDMGGWAGPANATTVVPAKYTIDYVRAYSNA